MKGNIGGTDKAKQSIDQAAKLFSQSNFAKQLVAGTASGWVTGAVVRYAGRGVAIVAGSGLILYEIAHHQGYVKRDLEFIKQVAKHKTKEFSKNTPAVNKIRVFAAKNKVFTVGFLGGFLLGIAI